MIPNSSHSPHFPVAVVVVVGSIQEGDEERDTCLVAEVEVEMEVVGNNEVMTEVVEAQENYEHRPGNREEVVMGEGRQMP